MTYRGIYMDDLKDKLIATQGGIGDFLQCLPYILANPTHRYISLIHFKGYKELFRFLKFKPQYTVYYITEEEKAEEIRKLNIKENGYECPRTLYFDKNPFGKAKKAFNNDRKTIGVQVHASKNAQYWLKLLNKRPKNIPAKVVTDLAKDYNVLFFGLPDDIAETGIQQSEHIKFVSFYDIAKSLSYVEQCDAFVGCDSAIKTLSVMLRIPTFVWIGDHEDGFRDNWFVGPYEKDGTMGTYRFDKLDEEYDIALTKTKEYLNAHTKV